MFDVSHKLNDSGAVTSSGYGTVDAAAKVVNLGAGLVRGNVIVDIAAINVSSAKDEAYTIHLIGGSDASFTKQVSLCSKELGHNAVLQGNVDAKISRVVLPFQNEERGVLYPYVRIRHVIAGADPSISYVARLEKDLPQTGTTALNQTTTTTTTV